MQFCSILFSSTNDNFLNSLRYFSCLRQSGGQLRFCFIGPLTYEDKNIVNCSKTYFQEVNWTPRLIASHLANFFAGLYTGTSGVAYAFYYLAKCNLLPECNDVLLSDAEDYISVALDEHNIRSDIVIALWCQKKHGAARGKRGLDPWILKSDIFLLHLSKRLLLS